MILSKEERKNFKKLLGMVACTKAYLLLIFS
jgi:hypothetical protein